MLTVQRQEAKPQRWRWQITAVPSALFISPLSFLLPASIRLAEVNCTVDKWRIVKSRYKSSHSTDLLACPPTRNRGSQGHSTATSPLCRLRAVLQTTVRSWCLCFLVLCLPTEEEEETLELNDWDVKYVQFQRKSQGCYLNVVFKISWFVNITIFSCREMWIDLTFRVVTWWRQSNY